MQVISSYQQDVNIPLGPESPYLSKESKESESVKESKESKGHRRGPMAPGLKMKNPGFTRARAFAARYRPGLAGSLVAGVNATGGHRLRTNHRVPFVAPAEPYPESTWFASSAVNDGSVRPASFLAGDF